MSTALVLAQDGTWELGNRQAPDMLRPAQLADTLSGVWWAATGLMLPENLSYDRWERIGRVLTFMEASVHFALGDWIRYGERTYGEMYSQAIEETPYSHGTLRNDAWVSGRIELSRRRDKLPYSHHQVVAPLEPEDQDRYLDAAERDGWTLRELREAVRGEPVVQIAEQSHALDDIGALLDTAKQRLIALSGAELPESEIRAVLDALDGVFVEFRVLTHIANEQRQKRRQP